MYVNIMYVIIRYDEEVAKAYQLMTDNRVFINLTRCYSN